MVIDQIFFMLYSESATQLIHIYAESATRAKLSAESANMEMYGVRKDILSAKKKG